MVTGLAQAGADVVIASRKLEGSETVAGEVSALAVAAHAGRLDTLDALLKATYAQFGRLDILINNAGTDPVTAGLSVLTPELFQKVFDVNTNGPWHALRAAPRMAGHGGGSIINVISVGGRAEAACLPGLLCRQQGGSARHDQGHDGRMGVPGNTGHVLAPGSYHSDMFDSAAAVLPGFLEGSKAASLQKRVAATDEIVGSMLYLASEMSSFITGSTLVTDGGHVCPVRQT